MTESESNGQEPPQKHSVAPLPTNAQPFHPIGAWTVAALVLIATLTMWTVVSIIFYAYS